MLSKEVYFTQGRWRYAIVERGKLRQTLDRICECPCRNRKEAHMKGDAALKAIELERKNSNAPAQDSAA